MIGAATVATGTGTGTTTATATAAATATATASASATATTTTAPRSGAIDIAFLRRVLSDHTALPDAVAAVIREFLERVETLREVSRAPRSLTRRVGFEHEYRSICSSIDGAPWFTDALTPQTPLTLAKNRYCDVLPFEQTRVRLQGAHARQNRAGDYINANFVSASCIACCAPVPSAIADFWHMVWQCDVHVVLMLTKFVERERRKADLYWDASRRPVDFHGVFVELVSEEMTPSSMNRADATGDRDADGDGDGGAQAEAEAASAIARHGVIVRSFKLWTAESKACPRWLQHVQLTTWPDHGVLRDFTVIAPMLELVNSFHEQASMARGRPTRVVVHCSAGIGRSGTFIAIDTILKALQQFLQAAQGDGGRNGYGHGHVDGDVDVDVDRLRSALDVAGIVHQLRSQRPGMVQTPEQYEMIYRYIAAVLTNSQPW